jgi:DNA-binding Lrp family transcriptional regulator
MITAYVLINCDIGKKQSTVDYLQHLASVKEVHNTFGAYDIVAKLEHAEKSKLMDMITNEIRQIDSIRSTLTLLTMQK